MPTYKNDTGSIITRGHIVWQPGETKVFPSFLPSQVGLSVVDDEPIPPSPVLFSEVVALEANGSITLDLPYSSVIKISSQIVGKGEASIWIGGKEILLTQFVGWESVPLHWGSVGSVGLTSEAGASVQVLVEAVI